MKYVAVYLMLKLGGKEKPTADEITSVLGEVGIEADQQELGRLMSDLEGKDVDELMAYGQSKLSGCGGGGGGSGGGGPAAASGEAAAEEEKPEEEEEEEEIDMGGGMDMFGDEDGGGGDDY